MEDRGPDGFVGVDWASQTHHVSVIDAEGREVGERGFTPGGEGLAETAASVRSSLTTSVPAIPSAMRSFP